MKEIRKQKPGRPPKEPWQGLKNPISLHLDNGDYAELMSKVEESGLSRNQFCIRALKEATIRPALTEDDASAVRDLQGVANNLNQLTRLANGIGFRKSASKIDQLMNHTLNLLSKYRRK